MSSDKIIQEQEDTSRRPITDHNTEIESRKVSNIGTIGSGGFGGIRIPTAGFAASPRRGGGKVQWK